LVDQRSFVGRLYVLVKVHALWFLQVGGDMTVMIDRFFGLSQQVVKSGLWERMLPGEKDLYIYLMLESERRCTRQLRCSDTQIKQSVGVGLRTISRARIKLHERGLILCVPHPGDRYEYVICNPATGKPYPGDPKERIPYVKQTAEKPTEPSRVPIAEPPRPANQPPVVGRDSEFHGVSGIF
jgi:hypothetical protein